MDYTDLANQLIDLRANMPQMKMDKERAQMMHGEAFTLNFLAANGNKAYPKDLSKALMLTSARIASILKSLEKRELITRTPDPSDSRQTIVELTETGISLVEERKAALLLSTKKMLEALGEDDAKTYVRIQKKLMELSIIWR